MPKSLLPCLSQTSFIFHLSRSTHQFPRQNTKHRFRGQIQFLEKKYMRFRLPGNLNPKKALLVYFPDNVFDTLENFLNLSVQPVFAYFYLRAGFLKAKLELPPGIRAPRYAAICGLLIFDKKEIRYVEMKAISPKV